MRTRYLVFNYNPLFGKCPLCEDHSALHRSQVRKIREHLVSALTLHRLYRCGNCGWRGHLFTFVFSRRSLSEIFLYTGLAGAACFLLTQVLRRLS